MCIAASLLPEGLRERSLADSSLSPPLPNQEWVLQFSAQHCNLQTSCGGHQRIALAGKPVSPRLGKNIKAQCLGVFQDHDSRSSADRKQ